MAPVIQTSGADQVVDMADLKSENNVVVSHVELAQPPVADNFMYDFKYNHELPTIDVLGLNIPADCDAQKEAEGIVNRLSEVMGKGDAQGFTDMFLDYGKVFSNSPLLASAALCNNN